MERARRTGTQAVEVRLLGPIEALRDGRPAALGGPKPRTLLTVLALDLGRVVSVDRLVEALWPGEAPGTAPHAVQVYVSQLRKALGPVIATRPPGYVLELEPERVDLHRFTRLAQESREAYDSGSPENAEATYREALALWRGPALADFLYEPFAQTEIARLEELRTVVLEERIEADLALGRHAELVAELEALAQAQPHRERPRVQLMLALYRSGRQADALSAYRTARETLVEELGIEPGPELKELEAAILRQDHSLLLSEEVAARPAMQFRRLATILFCDVVESMAVAETLDAEALGSVQRRYFETVSAAITRHGGTVEKYAGDAVMAAFGVPISHEDDALRAARAALDIQTGVAALNDHLTHEHGFGLEIRIGIAAGEVVAASTESRQRFVAGDAVGVAARLEHAARPGEIVVGDVVARLIDHAASLEPLGELKVKSRKTPIRMFRLLQAHPVAPAFEQRLEAKLVGRKRELAALRRALKRAVERESVRVALIAGAPGVGKSRLAGELTRRAKGVTTLWGRCLSYGEGITYWPLREVLEQAPESEERDAVRAALEADVPPPASEIGWLFRQLCEALARERPLVLVLDDVHWAEPTFLDLVEHLADKGGGPILVVCLAREELLEDRPMFLEGRGNVERLALEVLSADETDALLEGLGGEILESDQRARVVEAAEGNPFFLEQLLALALEGGLADRALPETVQALLAARLDRLGPGERAVLERGAVIGKEFRLGDVVALLEPEAAPTAEVHMQALAARGFVRPVGQGEFRFRHVLVQQAVYRAAPKRLRAELHERYTDRFDERGDGSGDVDEFAGYHLEQAYRLRVELGESGRRTRTLAEDGGRRLGGAGVRAFRRGDMHATANLLERATSLLPPGQPLRRRFLCDLGLIRHASHDSDRAVDALAESITESRAAGDRQVEWWARIEHEYVQLQREPKRTADDLLDATAKGIPFLESAGEDRAVGRAWVLTGWAQGGRRGNHTAWAEAAERALVHYKTAEWPTATCLGQIAAALHWGPVPVNAAITRCEQLLRDEVSDRAGGAYVLAFLGGLIAQQGDFDRARELVASARATLEDLGLYTAATTYCLPVRAEIDLVAGDMVEAVQAWRGLCDELVRSHQLSRLASAAGELADALATEGSLDEALEWTVVAESHGAADDVHAQMRWRPVRAEIHAHRRDFATAMELARDAAEHAESTDDLNRTARAQRALSEVLRLAGNRLEAERAMERAIELYEKKGNVAGAVRTRLLEDNRALV